MRITLQIENVDRLQSGGQVSYSCADRGFDIGRHEHLDWSLPDPQRVISGKHCEVRFEDGNFVLYDISTNGTFLNGNPNRMDKAQALRSGDRIMIGDYIISVALEQSGGAVAGMQAPQQAEPPNPGWAAPHQPAQPASDPAWPSQSAAGHPSPYPAEPARGPWDASSGMEGRHAPPSSAPGIGTPADSVWGQEGHGWGSAEPGLYDTQPNAPAQAPSRPAQADPMDHLAAQPQLASQQMAPPEPLQVPSANAPAPPVTQSAPAPSVEQAPPTPEAPLFAMPDLGEPEGSQVQPAAPEMAPTSPAVEASPFPETRDWAGEPAPVSDERAGAPIEPTEDEQAPAEVEAGLPEPQEETPAQTTADSDVRNEQPPAVSADFIKAFSEGAGIPASVLEGRDPEDFARELGSVLQDVTSDLMGLLQARSQVKAMTRNANRTLISRSGNNALKFSPTAQSALQTMLSQNAEESGYLPLPKAMSAAFKDIQKHHVWTYAAMQKAAARFEETLSPKAIEDEGQVTKSAFGNQNAKLWDRIQERWTSLSGAYDDGLVGVFTQYFTEGYEELSGQDLDPPA